MSVIILGDKDNFLSKTAITRFKKDVKEIEMSLIDDTKYLKTGFMFKIEKVSNDFNVNIITKEEDAANNKKIELRQKLKKMLNNTKVNNSMNKQKLESLKRCVPKKVFDSYVNLISKYKMDNVPAPDDVINDVEKYRLQISTVMGKTGPLSNDAKMSNALKNYFNTLGNFLDITPLVIDMNQVNKYVTLGGDKKEQVVKIKGDKNPNKENDDDTDEED